jgi:hypothetical protein
MSYDAWKTTNPADNALGRSSGAPTIYRCLTCGWKGRGSIARANHWQVSGHKLIVPKDDPRFEMQPSERKAG